MGFENLKTALKVGALVGASAFSGSEINKELHRKNGVEYLVNTHREELATAAGTLSNVLTELTEKIDKIKKKSELLKSDHDELKQLQKNKDRLNKAFELIINISDQSRKI